MMKKIILNIFVIAFLLFSTPWAQGRISVIGVLAPNAPTLTKSQSDRLKNTIRNEVEQMDGFYIVEDKLMLSILDQQNIKGSCDTDVCYFGIGSLMGAEFIVGCNLNSATRTAFSGEMVLFDISNRKVMNRVKFSHSGDFNSFISNQIPSSVRDIFNSRIESISSNVRKYRTNLGEDIKLDYSFSPTNAPDDIMVRINNPALLKRVDRKTLSTTGQGSTFIELYSLSNPSISTRVEVEIRQPRNKSSSSLKTYITPYMSKYAMHHGPTVGIGIAAGIRFKKESAHYFGFEAEKGWLPKKIWWYKENEVSGWAAVYMYDKSNQKSGWSFSPGLSFGNRKFNSKHYFEDREDFLETTINYHWSPVFKIQKNNFSNTVSFLPNFDDFMGLSAIKINSGYEFSF